MLRAKRGLAALVALGTLAVGTLAVASGDRRPDTDSVMTTIVFSHVAGKTRSLRRRRRLLHGAGG